MDQCSPLSPGQGEARGAEGGGRGLLFPEGPSTQSLRTLVPKAINGMVFGTRVLNHWVLGPLGI